MRDGFVWLYGVGAAVALPIVLWRAPDAILGWAAFVVFLAVWTWRVRRVGITPYVVEVDAQRFVRSWTGGDDHVDRAAVATVRCETMPSPRTGPVTSLRLVGHDGQTLAHVSLPREERDAVAGAMARSGWPVERLGQRIE